MKKESSDEHIVSYFVAFHSVTNIFKSVFISLAAAVPTVLLSRGKHALTCHCDTNTSAVLIQ